MNTIHTKYDRADDIIQDFVKNDDKLYRRYVAIFDSMQFYIEKSDCTDKVLINPLALGCALTDYFADIRRLKEFHNFPHINSIKLVSYLTFWLLKRKPIQVIKNDINLIYINERFAVAYILEFLNDNRKSNIAEREDSGLNAFFESLFYFFKYRHYTAQDIEMILLSFFAGRIYQSDDKDISGELPVSDQGTYLDDI